MAGIPFGKYQLVKRLARGGMAEVFLARQSGPEGFHRQVAVKRILPHLVDSQDFVRMFLDEARLAAQLGHPNVVHIYDFGKVDEHYFIAMEYVESVHAGTLIKHAEKERLPDVLVARIGADACAGLNYAHELRDPDGRSLHIVHRDVSPPNLLVSYDGAVKLVDFGIAKAVTCIEQTRPGVVKGKFAYMSPEQTVGQKLDGRSDVFSLAIVLWELLAGKILIPRTDPVDGMRMLRDGRFPPIEKERPDLPPHLAGAINRAMKVKRDERATAIDLGLALEEFIKASPGGIGSSLELAAWIRDRFPRDNMSGSYPAIRDEPQGTRQATGATRVAPPQTGEVPMRRIGSLDHRPTSTSSHAALTPPAPVEAVQAISSPRMPTDRKLKERSRVATGATSGGGSMSGVVLEPMSGSQSSSVIIAPEWVVDEQDDDGMAETIAMDETQDADANDFTIAQSEPTDNDITRILVQVDERGTGEPTGTALRARGSARRRTGRAAILVAIGAAAGLVGAVLLTSDGSDAQPAAGPVAVAPTGPSDAMAVGAPVAAPVPAAADAAPAAPEVPEEPDTPQVAVLDITTRPAGAKVTLGDRRDPKSPAHFEKVVPDVEHTLKVTLKGYQPLARKVELAAGEHRSVELDLVPTAATQRALERKRKAEKRAALPRARGVLNVRTRPYSEVFLGDRRLGQTPFLTRLEAGRYTLLFKHPGKPTQKRIITVKPGETTKLDFAL
jgi:serine/threonine protein kinase